MLRYWLRIVNQDKHIEITKAITSQVSGSIRINELAGNFSFECKNLKDEDDNFINSIPEGSEITITNKELTEVILHSFVLDDGIEIVSSDRKNDSFYFAFSVKCLEKDFSVSAIDEIIFTDTNFSDIISELLNYSDDSLGGEDTPKIKLNFTDFLVNAFTTQKKGLQDTLTDLVEQFDLFWTFNYKISLDTTNNIKVIRYIVISNKDGIAPDNNSFWAGGINTNTVKTGYLENTFTGSKLKLLPAETDIKIKRDNSVIINQLELTGKIFSLDNSESLTRLVFPAEPSKFTYDLGVFASDIKYISFNLRPSKDPVKLLENNTNTSVKIPSNFSLDIKTGDIAYFPNYSLTDFFPVLSVNKIDNIKTEVIFNTLPFLPAENDSFEIISNVEIFEEDNTTQSQINYASKGVVKQLQKNQNAKITFLDLSEPPPGVEISVFLYKLQDQNLKLKNSESIKERGLRYREIKLDDDLILNYQALNELGQKLLQDKPRYLINVSSLRYNLAPLGLSIPFNVNNLYQNNVILQENRFNFSHVDENKKPVFMQNIIFSNLVSDPNKYIAALKRQTANNRKIKKAERELRNENIFILENITYSITNPLPDLIANEAANITSISFDASFNHIGAFGYVIEVSNTSSFSTILASEQILGSWIIGATITENIALYNSGTLYYRVKAINSSFQVIMTSNTKSFFVTNLAIKAYLRFENNTTDQSTYSNNATNHGGTYTSAIAPNYSHALTLDGINDYVDIPSNSNMNSNKFACSLAFNWISIQNPNLQTLFSRYKQTGSNGDQFVLDYYGDFSGTTYDYKIRIVIYDSSNSNYLLYLVPYTFALNTDYLITLTYKQKTGLETSSTLKLYINGVELPFSGAGFVDQSSGSNLSNLNYGSTTQNGVIGIGGYWGGSDIINDGFDFFPNIAIQDFRYQTEFMTLSEHQALNSEIFGV